MNNKEIWAIISIDEVLKYTEVEKVIGCYDFEQWEIDELMKLQNNTSLSLNEFRWMYLKETLEITDCTLSEEGFMVRDLIDDFKMGYNESGKCDNLAIKHFEYELYRDFETLKINNICIYYYNDDIDFEMKKNEVLDLISYLGLNNGQVCLR